MWGILFSDRLCHLSCLLVASKHFNLYQIPKIDDNGIYLQKKTYHHGENMRKWWRPLKNPGSGQKFFEVPTWSSHPNPEPRALKNPSWPLKKVELGGCNTQTACWLTYPSEKSYDLKSVGIMKFPMESHNPFMFQTTNQPAEFSYGWRGVSFC